MSTTPTITTPTITTPTITTPTITTPAVTTPAVSTPAVSTPTEVPPAAPVRTAAELKKALLALSDLLSGFSVEADGGADGPQVVLSSKDSRCAKLVAYSNADNPPGSKAAAGLSYSGGSEGPFIDESLDAMGSAAAVRALQTSFRNAVVSCRSMTLKIPGQGSSPISVRQVSAPQAGTDPVAVRFTATSGPLQGLEVTMITTGINDVALSLTIVAGTPDDIDGATETAVDKAKATLKPEPGA
ncbi:hypothetical protein ACQHIV_11265 [Kribbella sp. GL6]|uniref:hypothetical protein n=1 Tax=Kribbella sp. GL6 TaxID=3419765 RepID=UPI003CFD83E8